MGTGTGYRPAAWRRAAAAVAALALLSGCISREQPVSLVPPDRPPQPKPAVYAPSPESRELAQYYQVLEDELMSRGLLRTDGGGPDTPYDAEDLAENFEAIAFYDEYARSGAAGPGSLARWPGPVRLGADFAPSVPGDQRAADLRMVQQYARRLARITGHPISTAEPANFHVIFAGKDDSAYVAQRVKALLPNISAADLRLFSHPPRSYYCLVVAGGPEHDPLSYSRGVALVRAEHPPLARKACVHEEVAQGLGLRNDSPRARPSIFNDDDEFALLTRHDEKLLQMLYDPRLKPGMTAEEARPVAQVIAAELMGEPL